MPAEKQAGQQIWPNLITTRKSNHHAEVFPILTAKRGNRVVIGVQVGCYKPHRHITVRRPLNPPRGENPAHVTLNQQGQHHALVILGLARLGSADMKGVHLHTLNRLNHEMGKIVIANPVFQIRP